jgi:hypothetical protein
MSSHVPKRGISIIVSQHPDILNPHRLLPTAFIDSVMFTAGETPIADPAKPNARY